MISAEREIVAAAASREEAGTVDRFMDAIEKEPVPYQAVRRLEASSSKLNESAWMDAFTEYTRDHGFVYRVLNQGGSQRILDRGLRAVLESEKDTSAEWRRGALTRENYDMVFESRTPEGLI